MAYYHDLVTQQSWEELQKLKKDLDFVLIGGWATYLYTKALKSKDIDILIQFDQLAILAKNYLLSKNDRLKKYEAIKSQVQIDIYLPHFSTLGIPVETLLSHSISLEGFTLLDPNFLLALKIYTLNQRGRSVKGRKDFLDIVSLVLSRHCDLSVTQDLLQKYQITKSVLSQLLQETTHLPELNLNAHQFSRVKKLFSF